LLKFPITIDNGHGEILCFKELVQEDGANKLIMESRLLPGCGQRMHVHFKQEEHFHIVKGMMSFQTPGNSIIHLTEGMSVSFLRNQPHRFWNSGNEDLVLRSWISPAHNTVFYLSTLYASAKSRNKAEPALFDGAYLTMKYKSEYATLGLPESVTNLIMPLAYFIGKLLGKYKKFKTAPEPVK
jgi:mannose-6-phosphate isomerase-like protein (cupin superfamily)